MLEKSVQKVRKYCIITKNKINEDNLEKLKKLKTILRSGNFLISKHIVERLCMYNYSKKSLDNKGNNDYINELFVNNLYNFFPRRIIVAKNKQKLKKGNIQKNINKTFKTLKENEYIYFNKYTFNFLIIDIDNKKNNINTIINILDDNFIAPPTWIIETNSGYQVGFLLEKPFNLYNNALSKRDKKALEYALYVQKKVLFLLGGDFNANRLQGFWKNPMGQDYTKFKFFYNFRNVFNLSDFDIYLPFFENYNTITDNKGNPGGDFHYDKEKIKLFVEELILKGNINILSNIDLGFRNSFLWYLGMYMVKHDINWEDKLETYNNNLKNPIKDNEMGNIKKSIKQYTLQGKNFVGLGSYENWTPELKRQYSKNYKKKKGITKLHNEERVAINKQKIRSAILRLYNKNEKLTNENIAKEAKLGLTTTKKYKKQLIEEDEKIALFFKK